MTETQTSIHTDGTRVDFTKLGPAAGLLGIVLTIVSAIHAMQSPTNASSYLFGWIFWAGIAIGMLGLTLLHHTVRSTWMVPIMRLLEAGGGHVTLLIMMVLFLPMVIGVLQGQNGLSPYVWADPAVVKASKMLQHKALYLNPTGFTVRWVLYFALGAATALYMRNSTRKQDATKNFRLEAIRSSVGALALPFFVLSLTFAVTDWGMSLTPTWYSTMYGAWTMIGCVLAALAFCTYVVCTLGHRAPYNEVMSPKLTKDLGNMLFVFTMLWGYTALSQFLIIWNGNLPETTTYMVARSSSAKIGMGNTGNPVMGQLNWGLFGFIIVLGQFFIPFFTLLSPRTKRFTINLKKIALAIFIAHILDVYMLIMPSVSTRAKMGPIAGIDMLWDALAFFGIGGIWLASFAYQTKRASLLPEYDNRLQEALAHAH